MTEVYIYIYILKQAKEYGKVVHMNLNRNRNMVKLNRLVLNKINRGSR